MPDEYVKRSDVHRAFQPKYAPAINRVFATMIDSVPAADVVAVRHEQWIDKNQSNRSRFQYWICSGCGYARSSNWAWEKSEKPQVKYCENCGAKMDGGQDE